MTDDQHRGDEAAPLRALYRLLNAWEGLPIVTLFFVLLGVVVVLLGVPRAAAVIATLAAVATYTAVTLRDLKKEEPVGVLRDEEV